jgi:hypothetical protein
VQQENAATVIVLLHKWFFQIYYKTSQVTAERSEYASFSDFASYIQLLGCGGGANELHRCDPIERNISSGWQYRARQRHSLRWQPCRDHDRTVLEKGAGLLRDADKLEFEAASLQIIPATKDSVVQVEVEGPSRISVAARIGSALVRNSSGVLVASLQPGMELAFDAGGQGTAAVNITGILQVRNGNYYITDPTAHVTIQVQGSNLARYVGKKVEVTGSQVPGATPAGGASELVQVTSITPVGGGGGGGAGGGAGALHLGTYAIIGGVAVGGTIIGLAAAGAFGGPASMSPK